MKVDVFRHVPFEDLGLLVPVLSARGADIRIIDVPLADLADHDPLAADLLVVLGGPLGTNDTEEFPFLEAEITAIGRRLEHEAPVLGICLGAQLMARALGARVSPARRKEIGWAPIDLTDNGRAGCLGQLGGDRPVVLHWHGDNFELPKGALSLASTENCPCQAFAIGDHALGLQFHLEVMPDQLEQWFVGHIVEIGSARGVEVTQMRADTREYGPALARTAPKVFEHWLERLHPPA